MNFLRHEREALAALLPSLDDQLSGMPLMTMEQRGNPAIALFRELGGSTLLIPAEYGGKGATPLQAVRIQCAIGNRAPSLAIATTMHHFSVATLVEMVEQKAGSGFEWMLLEGIAKQKLYLASGFAEGRSGLGILTSFLKVERTADGLVLNGSKKPCSLSASMDLLTASMVVAGKDGEPELAVATIPADTPGLERRRFWESPVLAGAESDEIVLTNVTVPETLVSYFGNPAQLNAVQAKGFLWFELLVTASYLGMATALVERCLVAARGNAAERVRLMIDLEGSMAALEAVAHEMSNGGEGTDRLLARALFARYSVQHAIERMSATAVELLGGIAFINSPEVAYLYAAARAVAFHPPSRTSISENLDKYLSGESLVIN